VRDESIQRHRERVVVVFPGALGDWLLALPALRAIRARHVGAPCTMVVNERLRALAVVAGVADETVNVDGAETAALFGGGPLPAWLTGQPIVYSWLGADDADLRRRVARAARRASFFRVERGPAPLHAAAAYARAVGVPALLHALEARAEIVPPPSALAADVLVARGPYLAIHPGAGARAKRWDVSGFVGVAQWWRSAGGTVLELAGPAEAGEAPVLGARTIRDWPLPDLAALLAGVELYLGNDSGVSHLAAAVGTPAVVLFGPTTPARWRPLGLRTAALAARTSGPDGISLADLPASRVIAACRRRFALTRGTPDISVARTERCPERPRRTFK